jgi:RNA polymerase sigma factor (sigma-70 family)
MSLKENQMKIANFFIKEHQNLVRYLRSRFNDLAEMEIEDVIGDIMLNLFNKADITAQVENLAAYIYRTLYNKAIDRFRKRNKTISIDQKMNQDGENTLSVLLTDANADLMQSVTQNELIERLNIALDNLEPKQKLVWIATELEGYSFRELAEAWEQPIGTLLARKHRATAVLQKALKDLKP